MSATYEDRYGLPLSAQGREAAEHYMRGSTVPWRSLWVRRQVWRLPLQQTQALPWPISPWRGSSSTGATSPRRKRVNRKPSSLWRA